MVNIQIRGPLVHIMVKQFTENEITDMMNNEKNISEFIYKNKDLKNCNNIFHKTFPILSTASEVHVSSFENDNYYDEGYTYFRTNLSAIISEEKNYKILMRNPIAKNIMISFMSGYGTGFETEIIDFDYKNFSPNDITCFSSNTFWNKHKIAHGINLNYLPLEDLCRDKYQISDVHTYLFNHTHNKNEISLGENFIRKTKTLHSDCYQIR